MPSNNQFSNTGVADGQPVEAFQVSQSFDAFTKQKDYDITLSGSLNLTGSLLMTGSLINEFSGQFKTLGLGVTAPSEPTMLHVKTSDSSNDPLVLIESDVATGDSMIYAKNPDTEWRYGLSGANSDSFIIQESKGGTVYIPFNIGTTTPDYTFQIFNGILGVGLGTAFTSNPSSLDPGSIQALNVISGSLVQGVTISASAAGENIHGTSSFASEAVIANTSSYMQLGNIDMSGGNVAAYSASGNFNTIHNIVTTATSSFSRAAIKGAGIEGNDGYLVISGSYNQLFLGNPEQAAGSGLRMEIDDSNAEVRINASVASGAGKLLVNDLIRSKSLIASGSSTPSLRVGPNTTQFTNASSASLFTNALQLHYNSDVYVGNYSAGTSAKLNLVMGGTSNPVLTISSSKDATFPSNTVTFDSTKIGGTALTATGSLFKLSQGTVDANRIMQQQTFRMAYHQLAAAGPVVEIFQLNMNPSVDREPTIDLTNLSGGIITLKATIVGSTSNVGDKGVSYIIAQTYKVDDNGNTAQIGTNTIIHSQVSSGLNPTTAVITNSSTTSLLKVRVSSDSTLALRYGGFVECTYLAFAVGA